MTCSANIILDRVSPLAVPVFILIGREQVARQTVEDTLLMEAEALEHNPNIQDQIML